MKKIFMSFFAVSMILSGSGLVMAAVKKVSPTPTSTPVAAASVDQASKECSDHVKVDMSWKSGINLSASDKQYTMKIGGCIFSDHYLNIAADDDMQASGVNPGESSNVFPKTRLQISGTVHDNVIYQMQFHHFRDSGAGEDTYALEDYYLGIKNIPYAGRLRVGQFLEPISMSGLISAPQAMFINGAGIAAFNPGRNTGLGFDSVLFDEKVTWALGIFQQNDSDRDWVSSRTNITGRITALPLYDEEGKSLFHVGLGMSKRYPEDVSTSGIEMVDLMNVEAAATFGAFSFMMEYMSETSHITNADEKINYSGLYFQASYFLGGSYRKYSTREGLYDAVAVNGKSDWELLARYSNLNQDDTNAPGPKTTVITLGTNWHIGKNAKLMLDYDMISVEDGGSMSTLGTRVQMHF